MPSGVRPPVTREYQVPKIPSFITLGSSLHRGSAAATAAAEASDDQDKDQNWTVVENPGESSYGMHNVVDNIMFSTNGYIGVKHRSETQTGVLRSYVKLNRVFHRVPLTQELKSVALPSSDEVGAVLCVVDLNVYVNNEPCVLIEMKQRQLSMRDASYRCECIIASATGELTFTMKYRRYASLSIITDWVAHVELSNFAFSEEAAVGTVYRIVAVTDISVSTEAGWVCDEQGSADSFIALSSSSGIEVATKTWSECTVRSSGESSSRPQRIPSVLSRDHVAVRGDHAPREQFQGADQYYSAFSSSECESPGSCSQDGSPTTPKRNWIAARSFETTVTKGSLPVVVDVTVLCRHETIGDPVSNDGPLPEPKPGDSLVEFLTRCHQASQRQLLDQFWSTFEMDVEYQDELYPGRMTLALRYGAYTAYCAGCGAKHGIARNALSSPGISMQLNMQHYLYHGIFYVFAAPQAAKRLVLHLVSMLPQARVHARRMSLTKGALYPHSTISGGECGSYFLNRSPRYHINADLAYVAFLFLEGAGAECVDTKERLAILEFLLETCRVWLELGEWQEHHTVFRIDEVAGPDEYSGLVEGNFYTHLLVKNQLRCTSELVKKVLKPSSGIRDEVRRLLQTLHVTHAELDDIEAAGDAIVLNRDDRLGVYFAHDHFDSLKSWSDGSMNFPLYLNYHPLVVYRHKLCEIPEVLLGMLTHPEAFEKHDVKKNLKYYEPFCTHDTPESLAVVAATHFRAYGDCGRGMPLLEAVAHLDLDNITYTADEGIHLSAMTSSWIAVVFGIGGLRIVDGVIHLYPSLPVGVEHVGFTLQWKGSVVRVSITADTVVYELIRGSAFRLTHFDHTRVHLHEGRAEFPQQLVAKLQRSIVQQMTAHFDGVVFSMESLVENLLEVNFHAWGRVLNPFFEEYVNQRGLSHPIEPFTLDEYVTRMVYQEEDRYANYSGLQQVLLSRGIELELGSVNDMEIVATRFGLANAKVEELRDILQHQKLKLVEGALELLTDLHHMDIRIALVSYTRSMHDALLQFPEIVEMFTTMIDGAEAREKQVRGRPHMDLFIKAARKMHIPTKRCVVFATHLDRGYRERDVQEFLALVDVEEVRTEELKRSASSIQLHNNSFNTNSSYATNNSSVAAAATVDTPLTAGPSASNTPLVLKATSAGEPYCSYNVQRVNRETFPKTTAELEDLVIGASLRRRQSEPRHE